MLEMAIIKTKTEIEHSFRGEMKKLGLNMEKLGVHLGAKKESSKPNKITKANRAIDRMEIDTIFQLADFLRMDVDDLALNKQQIGVNISGDKNLVGDGNFVNSDDVASVIARATKDDLEYWKDLIELKLKRES